MVRRWNKIRFSRYLILILLLCGVAYAANIHLLGDNKKLYFYDTDSGTDYTISFRAPELTGNTDYIWPDVDATTSGQALTSDASGNLGWSGALNATSLTFDFAIQDYILTDRLETAFVLQSQTSNLSPFFDIFTKDGDGVSSETIYVSLWGKGLPTDVNDSEALVHAYTPTGVKSYSFATGTGTIQPYNLYTGNNTTQLVLNTDNSIDMSGALDVTGAITGGSLIASDGTDQIELSVAGDNAYMKWNDGYLYLETDEGDNTDTLINIQGKGTGRGWLYVYDQDDAEYFRLSINAGSAQFDCGGTTPVRMDLQGNGAVPVQVFRYASEMATPKEFTIGGFRTGDALRTLEIGVGVDANDTASFDGVSNYYFDGKVGIGVAPAVRLDIKTVDSQETSITAANTNTAIRIFDPATAAGPRWGISWLGSLANPCLLAAIEPSVVSGWDTHLNFYTRQGGALTNALHLDENGKVGIGTTNPLAKLHVDGGMFRLQDSSTAARMNIWGDVAVGNDAFTMYFYNSQSTDALKEVAQIAAYQEDANGGQLRFRVKEDGAWNIAQVINKDGNVGIGLTTVDDNYKLIVRRAANVNFGIGLQESELAIAAFNDAVTANVPMRFYASEFNFKNGSVGINTTIPATKLQVVGTSRFGDQATNFTALSATGILTMVGTAKVTNSVWVYAGGIKAPGSKPATAIAHGALETPAWQFADEAVQANEQTISFPMQVSNRMDRSVAPTISIGWSTTTTDDGGDSEQVEWQLEYLWRSPDEATNAAAQETLYITSTASEVAEGEVVATFTGIDVPSATDVCIYCRVKRLSSATANGGAESDTIADDVELHGVCLTFTSNKLGKAS